MIRKILYILQLIIMIGAISCRAYRPPVSTVAVDGSSSSYINNYRDLAISEMKRTGVPASITLAQGMIESDFGRSSLARIANNHFGIKCHNNWKGPRITHHDDNRNECFRKYSRPEDSFYDHSDFLRSGSRYSFLFSLAPTDYKAWARGLKKAGYATNPDYANMLIRKIEENNLYNYDHGYSTSVIRPQVSAAPKPLNKAGAPDSTETPPAQVISAGTFGDVMARVPRIMENNRLQYIIVKDGDTREKIENEFQLLRRELARFNDLKDDFTPVPGQMLYLQPKREKAEAGKDFHNAESGETMHTISQKYGIKLRSLLEMNRMTEETEPLPGQKIWLRETKPVN
ncbi:MAG TPA: glucosaminidase domain-containing protein [Bacteroidales bacterium]|nr:glucosaminidase domain-containing protein [Bacteroidales bacterium]